MSPKVGSIYNMGVWDNTLGAWVRVYKRCALALEAAARKRYRETGRSLDNGGCVGELHIVVERCFVYLCILHCDMAIGRLQVAFIEACVEQLPKDTTAAGQRQLYQAHTGVKLGATASPDGEESRALFLASDELGPMLAYSPEDPDWQAVVAMRELLRALYTDPHHHGPAGRGGCAEAPRALLQSQSNHLLYLEEDVTEALANAAGLGGGWGQCRQMALRASTPSRKKRTMTTLHGGGGGCWGQTI